MGEATVLRTEVVEAQRSKSDLLKWKLILVAGLGAAALALTNKDARQMPVLFTLIPVVCVYIDVVCYHNDLRVLVISAFLRSWDHQEHFWRRYEERCELSRSVFKLENVAMYWATLALSLLVGILPFAAPDVFNNDPAASPICVASGFLGVLATTAIGFYFSFWWWASRETKRGEQAPWHYGVPLLVASFMFVSAGAGVMLCPRLPRLPQSALVPVVGKLLVGVGTLAIIISGAVMLEVRNHAHEWKLDLASRGSKRSADENTKSV